MPRRGQNFKHREARHQVMIPCRMKSVRGWVDACIHNISSRGMMIGCDDPLAPGEYVDIRRGRQVVIGRVIWRRDRFSGIRTQDIINADALINEPRLDKRPGLARPENERRTGGRSAAAPIDFARRHDHSRALAGKLQFGALCAFGVVAAVAIAMEVPHLLSGSTRRIDQALSMAASARR